MDIDTNKQIEEDEEESVGSLKDCMLHKVRMQEVIRETSRSRDFETNTCFVFVGSGESQETESKMEIKKAREPLEEPMQVYKGIDMEVVVAEMDFLEDWLDNPKNNCEANEMMMDCNNFIEDEDEVSMKKMQQQSGSNKDDFQEKRQKMIEDEWYPSEFMEDNSHFQQRMGDFY